MAQAKKPTLAAKSYAAPASSKAKFAEPASRVSDISNKAARATLSAVETTRNSAENVMKIGTESVKEFIAAASEEAQRGQEKFFAMSRETAEHFSRSADASAKTLNEAITMNKSTMEAALEYSNIAATMAQTFSSELFNYANEAFSQNVEMSKDMFTCRTVSDVADLQSRMMKANMDNFFAETARFSEMLFRFANEAAEPLNERMAEATERFSRALAA